ncbi:Dna-directed rna polymerase i subunit [Thalictrum thalictroides]|uniref:DNA-directed RNA polymerase subunit n=1 Tax=Thalictrum thalictroides TaxID=46969 RepID=A0A7J6V031_THATH|nr:Dna-directed rna polymerase i subunit [Thalictrum thalictroides]
MAHSSELATESVDSVKFSFLTTEEVRKMSVKKITEVALFGHLDRPLDGGLYDPALGPEHPKARTPCRTCGQLPLLCPGHCGHIDFMSPVYNPLLFPILSNILKRMCFFCHHFMEEKARVENCVSQLEFIVKGDIVSANCSDLPPGLSLCEEDGAPHATDQSQALSDNLKGKIWTSLQYSHARSFLDEFMKKKHEKCTRCEMKAPKLTHPTFGWIYMDMSNSTLRQNVIRGTYQDEQLIDESEEIAIIGGSENSNDLSTSGIKVDLDNVESTGAVYDAKPDSSARAKKKRSVRELPPEFLKQKKLFTGPLLPSEVKDHIELLWKNETQLCSLICDLHQERLSISEKESSYSMFFIEALLVPPTKFRPSTRVGDSVTNHPQTVLLSRVLESHKVLGSAHESDRSNIATRWRDLQQSVNLLFGNSRAIGQRDNMGNGICQLLEKKEGIFRQKMMGKRVNYSCRSVISPDPYIAVNEIGIPPCFALKLTYPERVTPWNVDKLRNAIINGPDVHPGAAAFSDQSAYNRLPSNIKMRISTSRKLPSSRGVATQPGKNVEHEHEGKVVYRHLQDGDIVLVNRQPTLHKPGIMAHVVRVLNGEKTLRMHYANCSTYNADFDGDEMNVHFPQDEISRAEAFHIVNANNQYIIPTSGDTKRGLIQDHIVAAVLLTIKDTFLSQEEFTYLLYSSGVSAAARGSFVGRSGKKVSLLHSEDEIKLINPAILKPMPLWSGKQVITSLLNHMSQSEGLPPFTFEGKCTIDKSFLTNQTSFDNPPSEKSGDPPFKIDKNDFLFGVIDKAQFGKFGLIHTVQELYGSHTAGILLSALSRLFTVFLQLHGFTCGIDDLLLKHNIDIERRRTLKDGDKVKILKDAEKIDKELYSKFVKDESTIKHSGKVDVQSVDARDELIERMKLQEGIEKAVRVFGESAISLLDKMMSNTATKLNNEVNNIIFPKNSDQSANKSKGSSGDKSTDIGLVKAFPKNCFFLMTSSGAKGSQANFTQVSSLLGQQSLEGKRVPLMISGKTLPCFPPWDPVLRAGGFITDCFLTGLRPQEYYFHCMAGREGLVDTAVKTSRSGYLQRCLVKNLEYLKVGYDRTVRDADGSIVQFCYGEDGVDVHKSSFMSKFEAIADNQTIVLARLQDQHKDGKLLQRKIKKKDTKLMRFKNPEELSDDLEKIIRDAKLTRFENFKELRMELEKKVKDVKVAKLLRFGKLEEVEGDRKECRKVVHQKNQAFLNRMEQDRFMKNLMMFKYLSSLAEPGEPVGVIAAQSVGEPSTQMTLNTFHHAGQKDSNVTLGIPRLQEILMRASEKIQTPIMSCCLKEGKTQEDAEHLAGTLRKVSVADIVESMEVSVVPFSVQNQKVSTIYKLKIKLYPHELFPKNSGIKKLEDCEETLMDPFIRELERALESHVKMLLNNAGIDSIHQKVEFDSPEETAEADPGHNSKEKDEENDSSDDEDEADDLGTDAQKRRQNKTDEMEYGDSMENQNVEGEPSEFESENDRVEDIENSNSGEDEMIDAADESRDRPVSKCTPSAKKLNSEIKRKKVDAGRKDYDRRIFESFSGLEFEIHFQMSDSPHILLSQIAQRAAKNVYIRKSSRIDRCSVINDNKKDEPLTIRTSGVDFHALWNMQDDLDISSIKSNDIHAILQTYGVEAARTTVVHELRNVFSLYGISTDFRHLGLIADFMTHSGKYRPMSRHGLVDSISPLSKMSFETASAFIVNAAYRGEVDDLESPSARICLGLPVKMGTGCFDLMQKVQV